MSEGRWDQVDCPGNGHGPQHGEEVSPPRLQERVYARRAPATSRGSPPKSSRSSTPASPVLPPRRDRCSFLTKRTIKEWIENEHLTLTKIHIKLARLGIETTYSGLYRFVASEIGLPSRTTVRMAETAPGEVAEVDFGRLGLLYDPESERKRFVYALVVTLVFSRHQYVAVSLTQDLPVLIAGMEDAWQFFGGVTRRVVIDNLRAAVVEVGPVRPGLQQDVPRILRAPGVHHRPGAGAHGDGKTHRGKAGALREEELLPGGDLPRPRPHPGGGDSGGARRRRACASTGRRGNAPLSSLPRKKRRNFSLSSRSGSTPPRGQTRRSIPTITSASATASIRRRRPISARRWTPARTAASSASIIKASSSRPIPSSCRESARRILTTTRRRRPPTP